MELREIRAQIDEIDSQLLPLFQARMDCARQVAEVKQQSGQPILNIAREEEILDRISETAGDYAGEARLLYATLMDMSRGLQHRILGSSRALQELCAGAVTPPPSEVIACFGRPGSFTRAAAKEFFPDSRFVSFESFAEIFAAVRDGEANLGVVPVENSSAGSVSEVYSLILQHRFYIIGARTLHIHQCLCAKEPESSLTKVYSHPQALAQCSEYLERAGLEAIPCSTTAEGARLASTEPGAGAMCSKQAAEENGLTVLREDVQNVSNNCTRFIVISRAPYFPPEANRISLCFSLPHKPGSLSGVFGRFAAAGMNLTKIESRPIPGRNFEYDFYLDFSGNLSDPNALELIAALQAELPRFSLLGNYASGGE